MKKPWDRGWIPKPGHKPGSAQVQAPKGWRSAERSDGVWEFTRRGATHWSRDVIVGRWGEPWKLWLNKSPGVFRAPDMQMRSLKALALWYEVETADRPEPEPFDWSRSPTGRQAAKAAALGARYGDHQLDALVYGTAGMLVAVDEAGVLDMKTVDFTKLEGRVCKTFLNQ